MPLRSPHRCACLADDTGAAKPRWLHATSPKLAGVFKHQDTEINSADTPFEFSEESEEKIAFTLAKCACLPTPKAGTTTPGSHTSHGAACGRYPETKQGMQSAIMPILWIVQQQLDKAHHITPTTVVKGAVAFPAQGSGGWVRPTLTLTRAVTLTLAITLTLALVPTLSLTFNPDPSP